MLGGLMRVHPSLCACAVKTGRPDVGELSRGQNQVRDLANNVYADNVTPTWQKGKSDGMVNIVGNVMQIFGFCLIVRGRYAPRVPLVLLPSVLGWRLSAASCARCRAATSTTCARTRTRSRVANL